MMEVSEKQQALLLTPVVKRIMAALNAFGETRIVGGGVRDVLLGRGVGDIDLATTVTPTDVMDVLARHHIKTVPTGLAHGTITAVVDRTGYEITTLRRDVETDGRHAVVAFTDDWQMDAARRDFTFNALYLDVSGRIYDYFDGLEDAKACRVRFIGDADQRIREDVLRILRFFRFYAWFGQGAPESEGLKACVKAAPKIAHLSPERVAKEILKLFEAPSPLKAWRLITEHDLSRHILHEVTDTTRLAVLLENEKTFREQQSRLTRLAAVIPADENVASAVSKRFKFSNRDVDELQAIVSTAKQTERALSDRDFRRVIYRAGPAITRAACFLTSVDVPERLALLAPWEEPVFPLKGQDVVKLGLPAGPNVGELLRTVEQWWIGNDFHGDREACLAQLKAAMED